MRRGEVWWTEQLEPIGSRPVLLLSRDEAYDVRNAVTIAQITTMNTTAYDTFRQQLSVSRNFRVELNISGAVTTYGPNLPGASNVYATSVNSLVEETNQNATVRVMSW